MRFLRGLPWAVVAFSSSAIAWAQATVSDDTGANHGPASEIREAARDRRSISLSGEPLGTGNNLEIPEFHTVERGDTLWDITGYYFQDPWRWPQVWGLNPQITNPHWIFPGDRIRLQRGISLTTQPAATVTPSSSESPTLGENLRPMRVAPQTVFLREQGWIDRQQAEAAGTIVGSPTDEMLLSEGDQAYVQFDHRTPHVGEEYTIYQDGPDTPGGGHVVRILGTATVQNWEPNHHVATTRITESLDTIERGERVAAIPRHLDVVPPVQNQVDQRATIVAAIHPRELLGQNMVVFLDKGSDDHIVVGNRLFVVRHGDALEATFTSGQHSALGGIDRDGDGNVDSPPGHVASPSNLPEDIVGEVRIVDVRPHSATALVTSSIVEIQVGDALVMRRGY